MFILDENFTLSNNSYGWTLSYSEDKQVPDPDSLEMKTVNTSWNSYHGDLKFAMEHYADASLKKAKNVQEMLNMINNLKATIKVVCADIKRSMVPVDVAEIPEKIIPATKGATRHVEEIHSDSPDSFEELL